MTPAWRLSRVPRGFTSVTSRERFNALCTRARTMAWRWPGTSWMGSQGFSALPTLNLRKPSWSWWLFLFFPIRDGEFYIKSYLFCVQFYIISMRSFCTSLFGDNHVLWCRFYDVFYNSKFLFLRILRIEMYFHSCNEFYMLFALNFYSIFVIVKKDV